MSDQLTKTSLKNLLAELVQMPTITSEQATNRAALDWVKFQLQGLPLRTTEFSFNGYDGAVFTTRRTKRPKVLLMAHIDVAPAPPEAFKFTERQGRYLGRGVFDMKFAVAAYIKVLQELGSKLSEYDLGVMINTEEELTGGQNGAAQLARAGWGGGVIINPDAVAGWAIQRAAKGILRYRLLSTGQAGHGSRPWQYRNAVTQLMRYLDDLGRHFPTEPCGDEQHAHATLNIGVFQGGEIANQVPGSALADIDIRMMPGQTPADMSDLVLAVAADHPYITPSWLAEGPTLELDSSLQPAQQLHRLITEVTGVEPALTLSHGGSESTFFDEKGMLVLMFGPPGGGHHSDDEWVDAQGVDDFAQIIQRFLELNARN